MDNLLQTGGAGGVGAIVGALMSFFGIKSKIDDVDNRVDKLSNVVVFEKPCVVRHEGLNQRLDRADKTQTEMRDDIKAILKEMRKQ